MDWKLILIGLELLVIAVLLIKNSHLRDERDLLDMVCQIQSIEIEDDDGDLETE